MAISNVTRSIKATRITLLNSKEVARSQPRISQLLSDNANKNNTRLCALFSQDAEKTSNLSTQLEKIPLLNELVSEAEGTSKMIRAVVKPNTASTSLWNLKIQVLSHKVLAGPR